MAENNNGEFKAILKPKVKYISSLLFYMKD